MCAGVCISVGARSYGCACCVCAPSRRDVATRPRIKIVRSCMAMCVMEGITCVVELSKTGNCYARHVNFS